MSQSSAWHEILSIWMTPVWKPLSQEIKHVLGLHMSMGVYNGMFVTRAGSIGMMEFIHNLNHKESK